MESEDKRCGVEPCNMLHQRFLGGLIMFITGAGFVLALDMLLRMQ